MASHIARRKFLASFRGGRVARAQQGDRVRRVDVLISTGERDPGTQLRIHLATRHALPRHIRSETSPKSAG
jgi:hypothetical protein